MNTHDKIVKCRSCGYVGPCDPTCCERPDYDGATAEEAWHAAIEADRKRSLLWDYCPECGNTEYTSHVGCGNFCTNCGQEWHSDIDYSEAVQKNLSDRKGRGEPEAAEISNVVREITGCPDIKNGGKSLVVALGMLFHRCASPQPTEPVSNPKSEKDYWIEGRNRASLPASGAKLRERGFVVVAGKHVPTVTVEFPVNDWDARDQFVDTLTAPQPSEPSGAPTLNKQACGAQNEHQTPQPAETVKCAICFEDEPHTGTCGSNDPRALCNRAAEPVKVPNDDYNNEETAQSWYELAWEAGARRNLSFDGDEIVSINFDIAEFESFCRALLARYGAQPARPMDTSQPPMDTASGHKAQPAANAAPIELQGIASALDEGDGIWRSCSGCHETNEGYDTGPYSKTLRCHLGIGCRECGGIGAIWDDTDYDAMADYMARGMGSKQPDEPVKVPSDDLAHEIWAAAQTAPGEGIEDAVERVAALLARYGKGTP